MQCPCAVLYCHLLGRYARGCRSLSRKERRPGCINWRWTYFELTKKCAKITYLLTPWCRVLLEKLTGLQLVKKFPAFHGTRRFITALTSVRHLSLNLGQPNPVHIPTSNLLEIHPNIIHPSTPRSPQWSLSLRFPHQDPIRPPSPHPYAPHAQPISFFSILSPAQYWVSSTNHLAPRYAIFSITPLPRRS